MFGLPVASVKVDLYRAEANPNAKSYFIDNVVFMLRDGNGKILGLSMNSPLGLVHIAGEGECDIGIDFRQVYREFN